MTRVCPAVRPSGRQAVRPCGRQAVRPSVCVANLNVGLYTQTNYVTLFKLCVMMTPEELYVLNLSLVTFDLLRGHRSAFKKIIEVLYLLGYWAELHQTLCQCSLLETEIVDTSLLSVGKKTRAVTHVLRSHPQTLTLDLFQRLLEQILSNLAQIYPLGPVTILPNMDDLDLFWRS